MDQPRNARGQFESESEERSGESAPIRAHNLKTEHISTRAEHDAARKAAPRMSRKEEPRSAGGEFE